MTARLAQSARVLEAVQKPDQRTASDEAVALWLAACKLQDRGLQGVDTGLVLIVRDKLDALLEARREPLKTMEDEHG